MKTLKHLISKTVGLSLLACIAAAAFGCFLAVSANAAPGKNGDIAFTHTVGNADKIVLANADGTNAQLMPVPANATRVNYPHWSPRDPNKLLFTARFKAEGRNYEGLAKLYIFDRQTGVSTEVKTEDSVRPSEAMREGRFSWNGRRIACASEDSILVMNANGRELTTVFGKPGFKAHAPAWSRDDDAIAFILRDQESRMNELVIKRHLSRHRPEIFTMSIGDSKLFAPAWAQDGSLIVNAEQDGRHFLIHVSESNGELVSRELQMPETSAFGPEVSPDGSKLLFSATTTSTDDTSTNSKNTSELYVADLAPLLNSGLTAATPLQNFPDSNGSWTNTGVAWQSVADGQIPGQIGRTTSAPQLRRQAPPRPPRITRAPSSPELAQTDAPSASAQAPAQTALPPRPLSARPSAKARAASPPRIRIVSPPESPQTTPPSRPTQTSPDTSPRTSPTRPPQVGARTLSPPAQTNSSAIAKVKKTFVGKDG